MLMRAGGVLAILFVPLALAAEPYVILLDWQDGHTAVGAPVGIEGVDQTTVHIQVPPCNRELLLDLLYDPKEAALDAPPYASAGISYEWRAQVLANGTPIAPTARVGAPGYGTRLGTVPTAGAYDVRVWLTTGADVTWHMRVRGHEVPGAPDCLSP